MKRFFKKILPFLIAPAFLLSFATLPAKINLSGEWKLNEGKSELGDFGSRFAARTIKVEQKDDAITISKTAPSFNGGDATTTETLTFDGKESETTVFGSSKKKSVAKWADDGQSLTISYTIAFERDGQTTEIKGNETWSLTKEGSLSLVTFSSSPRGDITTKGVYDK
jgi:hypothetical protein